ncbi:alpha/beta fold hydrolase [Sphingomonas cavernae]|uniref:Alpha/beta hydrolase n=1 Tax=Sphingomonas cavernae TaxID=2320861 RepID=A0A418WL53_9SPHN|nr:alpha/beta fold hydrolase [Sphingomonas cavernae]RJF90579.1 alpha/beta hydrolase [Sphingomonas cavernae]
MADFVERRWRSADGLSLHARDYAAAAGEARLPVICIHGLTRNARDFEAVAPWVAAQGRRVLAVDIRGRGRSDPDPDPMNYKPLTYARDMLAMMDSLGIARAVFVGTSMGGLITLMVAGLRLRAIGGAVLNDVGPEVAQEGLDRIAAYAGKPVDIRNWDDAVAYLTRTMGPAFPDLDEARWHALARRSFVEGSDGVPRLDYDPAIARPFSSKPPPRQSYIAGLLFRRLARRRPTLLLRGELSDLLSAEIAARMRRAAPTMHYAEVPHVGHAPLLEEPAARAAIEAFLAKLP